MTSNSFQFAFWILFNYAYNLNKSETINEIEKNSKGKFEKNLTSLGEMTYFVFIKKVYIKAIIHSYS